MLDFSVNTNPFGPSHGLLKVLKKNVRVIGEYPDHFNTEVIALIKDFLNVPSKNIALGVGSTQILFDIPKALSYKRAVILVPTFWEYTVFNSLFKKNIKKIILREKDNFKPDYTFMQKTIKPRDCVFICNVNNPTSVLYKKKELLALVKNNPKTQFVLDETYLIFRSDFEKQSLMKYVKNLENLHIIMSFSKFFSLPGVRLGVFVSNQNMVNVYNEQFHIPYSVSPFALIALEYLLKDKKNILQTQKFYSKERVRLFKLFNQRFGRRLQCFEPDGSFIMARILTGQNSKSVKKTLEKKAFLFVADMNYLG